MNAKEVAKILGIHPNTVYTMIREGEIEAVKSGRSYEIPQSEVDSLLKSKEYRDLSVSRERASNQLIVNVNSEIEAYLSLIEGYSNQLVNESERSGLKLNDYEERRRIYEDEKHSPMRYIVDLSKEIDRLETFKSNLQHEINVAGETNTIEKVQNRFRFLRGDES